MIAWPMPYFSYLTGKRKQKGDKQCLNYYRPVSLLLICGKILERLLFNEMFSLFTENDPV